VWPAIDEPRCIGLQLRRDITELRMSRHHSQRCDGHANQSPARSAMLYATDDAQAAVTIERLISAAGCEPVKAGGRRAALCTEMFGDLHQFGGFLRKVFTGEEARTALAR
jgi:hypothetical protein